MKAKVAVCISSDTKVTSRPRLPPETLLDNDKKVIEDTVHGTWGHEAW